MVNVSRLATGALLLSLLLSGCIDGSDDPKSEPSPWPTTSKAPTLESVAQDLLPGLNDAPRAESNMPARIDIPKQQPASFMTAPTARAKLGMVSIDDGFEAEGFAGQNVYFLGVDDQWRVLNLAELGLRPNDWTGPDGSGMGQLSPDGTQWVFETNRNIVVLDLLTRRLRLLSLPGDRQPVAARWTLRKTLLVGFTTDSVDLPTTSYEVDLKTGHSNLIKAPHFLVTVLADGSRAVADLQDHQNVVRYITASNRPITRREYTFAWDTQIVGMQSGRDVTVFLDSLGTLDPTENGSMLVVVDQSLHLKASLPWPKRTTGDDIIGWVSDDTFLLTYGETLAAWCPGQSKLARVSTVSNGLDISMAMDVVNASCA